MMGAMRIGYLVPEWPGQTHAFFWRELSALRALGNSVYPFSTRRPPDSACLHAFGEEARASTYYLYPPRAKVVARVLATRARGVASALAYVASLSETPPRERARLAGLLGCAADLVARAEQLGIEHVHVHSCANAAHITAMARLLGGPSYSLTLHGDLPVYGVDHRQKAKHARFVSVVTRPLQAQVLAATDLTENRVPVIWMGVDTDRFSPAGERPRAGGGFLLATVARLSGTKGHAFALQALKRVRDSGIDVRYAIAGEGPYRPEIEKTVRELGLEQAVELCGSLSENGVLALLHRADAFVLSSVGLGEAAPVSVMEAMACAVPVICSRIGGTADMITDGDNGLLVDQRDVGGLAAAMSRLATDTDFHARVGRAARERALRVFDYRVTAGMLASALGQQ